MSGISVGALCKLWDVRMALLTSGYLTSEHFSDASVIVRTGYLLAVNLIGMFARHVFTCRVSHAPLFTLCHRFHHLFSKGVSATLP